MRVNRAKFIRKYLKFFRIVFNLKLPYNVLLDGNFIFQALKYKLDVLERLTNLLQCLGGEVKIFAQKSVFDELKSVGPKTKEAFEFAEKYCTLIDDLSIPGDTPAQRLVSMLENLHSTALSNPRQLRYMVATQDKDLRHQLGAIPGIPLIYFNKVTLVLEPPSEASKRYNQQLESSKVSIQETEADILTKITTKRGNVIGVGDRQGTQQVIAVGATSSSSSISGGAVVTEPVTAAPSRLKRKALSANPLSTKPPSQDSNKSKRRKVQKFKK